VQYAKIQRLKLTINSNRFISIYMIRITPSAVTIFSGSCFNRRSAKCM